MAVSIPKDLEKKAEMIFQKRQRIVKRSRRLWIIDALVSRRSLFKRKSGQVP